MELSNSVLFDAGGTQDKRSLFFCLAVYWFVPARTEPIYLILASKLSIRNTCFVVSYFLHALLTCSNLKALPISVAADVAA